MDPQAAANFALQASDVDGRKTLLENVSRQWAHNDPQAALAWAFYRGRQFGEACNWIDRALASGAVEAHLFFRTGMIYTRANSIDDGRNYMERATRLNPSVEKFHLHH